MIKPEKKILRMLIIEKTNQAFSLSKNFSYNDTSESSLGISYVFKILDNCDEAIKYYNKFHPDIIVVRLGSDIESTLHLCYAIRDQEESRHTGIVVLQGATLVDPGLAVRFLDAGVDEFIDRKASPREIVARVSTVARFKIINDELRTANHQLLIQSLTDDLTSLHNMRSFEQEYTKIFQECREKNVGFSILMIDLDHFKDVNDSINHLVGSRIIAEVGKIIKNVCTSLEAAIPARYGGDEYIVCLPCDTPQEPMELGEVIRANVHESTFSYDGAVVQLTASIGFSWIPADYEGDQETPIKAADLMLYRSKDLGRNQVRGMMLRNAVDFDHVGRLHLVNGNASGNDNQVPRLNNIKFF